MKSELEEILSGFEKRMKFINIVRRFLDYSLPDDIKETFDNNREKLNNIIIAVLLYIKEKTLGNNESCNMSDIKHFIENLCFKWFPDNGFDIDKLSNFIIITALQNRGEIQSYFSYDSNKDTFVKTPIRILEEENNNYKLTDDVLDFLFRSKEIESEIDYSVTRFKMMEYIKRANYSEALDQSRELVSRIRSMKQSMESFKQRCRENIASISVDEYEKIIKKIKVLLEEEDKELNTINREILKQKNILETASNQDEEKLKEHLDTLNQVSENIITTITEQKGLINKKVKLSEAYKDILEANFATKTYKRMDFDQDIMQLLKKCSGEKLKDAASFLLFPLTKPAFQRIFSIENFYALQSPLNEIKKQIGTDLNEIIEEKEDIVSIRNERNKSICIALFNYMYDKECITAEEFIQSLNLINLSYYCEENAMLQALLTLYGMAEITIEGWQENSGFIQQPQGEFELLWGLKYVPTEQLNMKKIIVTKLDKLCKFTINMNNKEYAIELTNFELRIIR